MHNVKSKLSRGRVLLRYTVRALKTSHSLFLTKQRLKRLTDSSLYPPQDYNFDFMECSAATGENVIKALETVAR